MTLKVYREEKSSLLTIRWRTNTLANKMLVYPSLKSFFCSLILIKTAEYSQTPLRHCPGLLIAKAPDRQILILFESSVRLDRYRAKTDLQKAYLKSTGDACVATHGSLSVDAALYSNAELLRSSTAYFQLLCSFMFHLHIFDAF